LELDSTGHRGERLSASSHAVSAAVSCDSQQPRAAALTGNRDPVISRQDAFHDLPET